MENNKEFIETGTYMLDKIVSNGIPSDKITMLMGESDTSGYKTGELNPIMNSYSKKTMSNQIKK